MIGEVKSSINDFKIATTSGLRRLHVPNSTTVVVQKFHCTSSSIGPDALVSETVD